MSTIDDIAARHREYVDPDVPVGMYPRRCNCSKDWPCDATVLLAHIGELEGALREILNDADARDDANIGERLRHVDAARALLTDAPEAMP